ncbi:tetratricopeptide repeat protein [Desulfobacula sp.]
MKILKKNGMLLFLCFFLIVFIYTNLSIKETRKCLNANYSLEISNMPVKVIKILAGEFSGLFADYLLLQIGSYVGSNSQISNDQWKMIHRGFEQAFELDPYFQQTYIEAQAFLAWEAHMPKAAISLLERARQKRPWDWIPGYYIGFNYYYFLKNFQKASEIYLETAKIKNTPIIIALLGSRFAIKEKRTQASIKMLELMLNEPELSANKIKEITNRITILKSVQELVNAIEYYKRIFSVYPLTLDELVASKIIDKLPENPYKKQYHYDPNTGKISFD